MSGIFLGDDPTKKPMFDGEGVEQKLLRLMQVHNTLVAEFKQHEATSRLMIDTLLSVLDKQLPDFHKNWGREHLRLQIESTIVSRFMVSSAGNLEAFVILGNQLVGLKKIAKKKGLQSMYNKTVRRAETLIREIPGVQISDDFDFARLTDVRSLENSELPVSAVSERVPDSKKS